MKIDLKAIMDRDYPPSNIPMEYMVKRLTDCGYKFDYQNTEITLLILQYFLRDRRFLDSKLVTNENSFAKGILLFGDVGIGKSFLFDMLRQLGKDLVISHGNQDFWFIDISAGNFVNYYMTQVGMKNENRSMYIEKYYKGRLLIDDLGFEKLCFNSYELFEEILFMRHKKESPTFVLTNLKPSEITKRYGIRIGDRLPQMFNIIKWQGKSYRK